MVLKHLKGNYKMNYKFENDVIWYGTQTKKGFDKNQERFENDVIWYGTQTRTILNIPFSCLRMM